jgi:ribosomal protein L25 (general stress protein Ctc)
MTTLEIQARDLADNEALRKAGFLPAVVYGKKTPSTPISVSKKDFIKVWKEAGESYAKPKNKE